MGEIRGIVFDKDGTLFDFRASWSRWLDRLVRNLAAGDDGLAHRLAEAIGFDLRDTQLRPDSIFIAHTEREVADALMSAMPRGTPDDLAFRRIRETAGDVENVAAVPLGPLFDDFAARRLTIGLATNDGEELAHLHLAAAGIDRHFHFVAGYDSGFGAKPAPGQLLAFADLTGVDPAHAVMVGDSRHDLVAGRAAGMLTVGVLTGIATEADLAPLADVVLPHIGALPGWLDGR